MAAAYDALLARIEVEVIDRLDDRISEWKSNCGSDDDPDSYFDEFESMLNHVSEEFEYDSAVVVRVEKGLKQIKSAIESLNENRDTPPVRRVEAPTGRTSAFEGEIATIFDDVDQ